MAASSSSFIPTPLAHDDNKGEGSRGGRPYNGAQRNLIYITPSKWAEIIPLKKSSARVIANTLFDNYILRFGAPVKLISDNGPQFISDIFEHLRDRLRIRHVKTVVYRPQANKTERVNRDLVKMIANYVNDQHDTWDHSSYMSSLMLFVRQ
ncbi:retrovirus-related Pol polyprotein from transposon 17.6 [Trichonephila clavipes]|nr:retrovirus-related Pol polyprotein from transposon 17.6 [Trichonephila clavipes]